ncbi:MAG: response regulator transcription factor [Candidatus Pacebacteria bacterium]|nr:response regulator transcription factor [Candidatus Paceibacterota bacterium]
MRILVIEDTEHLALYIKKALEEAGYAVDLAHDGDKGESLARGTAPDLVVLDVMLPKRDGITVCKNLRADNVIMPILMLTALGESDDRVSGLDSGADDYLVKPFDMDELLARIRALLRRPSTRMAEVLTVQDLALDNATRTLTHAGRTVPLTLKEYAILEYLMRNANIVVSRAQILEHCWDFAYNPFSNITDVYIRQLRAKLHDDHEHYIETIRGAGYRLRG